MKEKLSILCLGLSLFLVSSVLAFSQVTVSGGVTMSGVTLGSGGPPAPGTWSDIVRRVTLAVGVIDKDEFGQQHFKTGGVAVLITDENNRVFIATALHVFSNPQENWHPDTLQIRGWRDESTSRYQDFGSTIVLRKDGKPLYTASSTFDLAILPATDEVIKRVSADDGKYKYYAVHASDMGDQLSTYDGEDVFVLGFPALVGEQYQQRALMRSGIVAWTDSTGPATHEFLIDARIFPGNSGGPVFSSPAGTNRDASITSAKPIRLLGLVSKTINAKPDVAFGVHLPDNAMVIGAAGVGVIEPAHELVNLMTEAAKNQQQ